MASIDKLVEGMSKDVNFESTVNPDGFKNLVDKVGFKSLILGADIGGTNFNPCLYLEDKNGELHELFSDRIAHGYDKELESTWASSFLKIIGVFASAALRANDYYQAISQKFKPLKCGASLAGVNNKYGADWRSTNCPKWNELRLPGYEKFFKKVESQDSIDIMGIVQSLEHKGLGKLFKLFNSFNDLTANGANSIFISVGKGQDNVATEMMGTGTNLSTYAKLPNGMIVGHPAEAGWGFYNGRNDREVKALKTMIKDKTKYETVTHPAHEEIRSGRGIAAALKFIVDDELKGASKEVCRILKMLAKEQPAAIAEAAKKGYRACQEAFTWVGYVTGEFLYGRRKILGDPMIVLTQNIYSENLDLIAKPLIMGYIDCMTRDEKRTPYERLFKKDMPCNYVITENHLRDFVTDYKKESIGLIKEFFNGEIQVDPGTKTSIAGAAFLVTERMLAQRPNEIKMAEQGTDLEFKIGNDSFTHYITYYTADGKPIKINGDIGMVPYPTTEIKGEDIPFTLSHAEEKPTRNIVRYGEIVSISGLVNHYERVAGEHQLQTVKSQQTAQDKMRIIFENTERDRYCKQIASDWAKALGYAMREVSLQFNFGQDRRLKVNIGEDTIAVPKSLQDIIYQAYSNVKPPAGPVHKATTKEIKYAA